MQIPNYYYELTTDFGVEEGETKSKKRTRTNRRVQYYT